MFAVLGMVGPLAFHFDNFTRRRPHEVAHHGHKLLPAAHLDPGNGIAVVFIQERDPFHLAGDFGQVCLGLAGFLVG